QQPDIPTRNRVGAIARRHQEVHLERPLDAAHEIAQENEASLEETEHQQLTVGVRRGDLLAELADPPRDRLLVEDDPLELTPARPSWPPRSKSSTQPAAAGPAPGRGSRPPGTPRTPRSPAHPSARPQRRRPGLRGSPASDRTRPRPSSRPRAATAARRGGASTRPAGARDAPPAPGRYAAPPHATAPQTGRHHSGPAPPGQLRCGAARCAVRDRAGG